MVEGSEGSELDLLADIIHQVPSVRDFWLCEDKTAVLSCSRQCRHVMHKFTTAIMLNTLDDLGAICSKTWPSLGIVVIKKQTLNTDSRHAMARCKLQLLALFAVDRMRTVDQMRTADHLI